MESWRVPDARAKVKLTCTCLSIFWTFEFQVFMLYLQDYVAKGPGILCMYGDHVDVYVRYHVDVQVGVYVHVRIVSA